MNTSLKIIIPVGLGLLAAALNWFSYQTNNQKVSFACVTRALEVGDPLDITNVKACDIPQEYAKSMTGTFLRFEERNILVSKLNVGRTLQEGELILKSDLEDTSRQSKTAIMYMQLQIIPVKNALHVDQLVEFLCTLKDDSATAKKTVHLGPFRIKRVGEMVLRDESAEVASSTIGIEVPNDKDSLYTAKSKSDFALLERVIAGDGEIYSFITHASNKEPSKNPK